jgi:7,8-dihydropterin-6-yl-methyl-4-(beta-D-ribofuranosyl)aminobenzene 5'-phosphate synthase
MRLTCLVDNFSFPSSPSRGMVRKTGKAWHFIAQHGFSMLIETPEEERVVFDTGPSPLPISHNLSLLGIEPSDIDLVHISHGHRDHTGGVAPFIEAGVPIHCSPDTFTDHRYVKRDGRLISVGSDRELLELIDSNGLIPSNNFKELVPGVHASGLIPRKFESQGSGVFWRKEGDEVVKDIFLDDQSLFLETDAGVAIICGCCHSGVLNVVAHAKKLFDQRIALLIGGLHLGGASTESLLKIAEALKKEGIKHIAPMHCSGFEAMRVFQDSFEQFELMGVGDEMLIDKL